MQSTGEGVGQGNPSERGAPPPSEAVTTGPGVVEMAIDVSQVAPGGTASSVIALNVKTLDQRQFQINLLASSSVPQLKSKIELETGVVTDRQRLIFRGKVLKNENNLAHYALENGHTLHLVIRPADAGNETASNAPSTTTPPRQGSQGNAEVPSAAPSSRLSTNAPSSRESPTQVRSNDEPDPSLVNSELGNNIGTPRVLATFAVPEGARSVPLLQSILSTIMNSVQTFANTEGAQVTVQEASADSPNASSPQTISSSTPTTGSVRLDSLLSDPTRNATIQRVLQRVQNSSYRQGRNARVEALLRSMSRLLERPDAEFPASVHDLTHPMYEEDIQAFRTQIETLVSSMAQLQPRFDRLPVALQEMHNRHGNRPSQMELVNPIFRSIEALQSLGDVAGQLARLSRRLFLRYNGPPTTGPSDDAPSSDATPSPGSPQPDPSSSSASPSPAPSASDGGQGLLDEMLERQVRRSDSFNALLREMRQFGNVTTSADGNDNGSMLDSRIEIEATIPIIVYPSQQQSASATSPQPPAVRRWNFEAFGRRVVRTLSVADLFGVLGGARDAQLRFIQHVGVQMIDGNDLPPMSPGTNRDWSGHMVSALRDYVDALPRFNHPTVPSATNLAARIVQSLSPFAAELVVFFIRGTNVEPANATTFLDGVSTFVGHMVRQVVTDTLGLLSDPSALESVLEDLLVHFGVARHTARFVVQAFLAAPGVPTVLATRPSHASTRRLDSGPDGDADGPAQKRPRQE